MAANLSMLRIQARELPEAPGVYFWKGESGETLYIGKAVNLRSRVTSYFSHARTDGRTRRLLSKARTIGHQLTINELEALLLESALIKQQQPPFNRALRAPRKLFYLKFDGSNPDPHMENTRDLEDDGSLYVGPFRTAAVMRETAAFLHAILPLRKCSRRRPNCAPCMYHQMQTCAAPLLDEVHRERHLEAITQLRELVDGRSDRILAWLTEKRDRLSDSLLFERAADVQERIDALQELVRRQTILEAAVHSRCVLILDPEGPGREGRLILVARGHVLSARPSDATEAELVRWVKAHDPLIRTIKERQSELDSAAVMERWLTSHRDRVRWIGIPPGAQSSDLSERINCLLLDHAQQD